MEVKDLTIEVTNRCNLKCKQCNIWAEKDKYDLTLQKIKELLTAPILKVGNVSVTGGEAFLHPKFDQIFDLLFILRVKKYIQSISLVSHGYLTNVVMNFLRNHSAQLQNFTLDFSVDGIH